MCIRDSQRSYRRAALWHLARETRRLSWALYSIFIEPSLAGGFLWQRAKVRPSYRTAGPCYLLSTPAACRNLTRHAGSSGSRTHAAKQASQAHCTAAHGGWSIRTSFLIPLGTFRDVAIATDFGQNLRNDLYSTHSQFATDSNIAISIYRC